MSPLPIFGAVAAAALLIGAVCAEYAYPAHRCAEIGIEVCAMGIEP